MTTSAGSLNRETNITASGCSGHDAGVDRQNGRPTQKRALPRAAHSLTVSWGNLRSLKQPSTPQKRATTRISVPHDTVLLRNPPLQAREKCVLSVSL